MKVSDSDLTLSPSDLSAFLACEHLTSLELRVAHGEIERPEVVDSQGDLIRRKGDEHEARYLATLRGKGQDVAEIAFDFDWVAAAAATERAIGEGREVIYQACLVDGDWRGFADFLERQPDGGYEAVDTKLARSAKPSHIFQLCFYSSVVGRIQGRTPTRMHIELGDGSRESFMVTDYDSYYRRIRTRFLEAVAGGLSETYPVPCEHCAICPWKASCEQRWSNDDHLVQVANIGRKQIERLAAANITTLEELGLAAPETSIERLSPETFATLRQQAALQLHHKRTQQHKVELLPLKEKRGFALMPPPSEGDVYYDIEGDPFYDPIGGLEYLHGVAYIDSQFAPFWARDRGEEKVAFEQLVDALVEQRRRYPEMHVYHYANYERSALERLMQRHGTREAEIDGLFRGHVFVDLFQVVRQALRISVPSYSLKKVEELYFRARDTDVIGGEDSTVVFEQWLESGDNSLLRSIEDYNRDDCLSTLQLHQWLLSLRPKIPWAEPPPAYAPSEKSEERSSAVAAVQVPLRGRGDELVADLLDFHRRDAKPEWWAHFRRLTLDEQELIEDSEAIGAIEHDASVQPYPYKRSLVWELTFPGQEFKVGSGAIDPATEDEPGEILQIDETRGRIKLKRGKAKQALPLPRALVPPRPLWEGAQQAALLRLAEAILHEREDYRAARDILARAAPRADLSDPLAAAATLDESYLFIQGPPGSGKTWKGAEMAIELMRGGRKVGIASQSHKAIHKFLDDVLEQAAERGFEFSGLKKASDYAGTRYERSDLITNETDNKKAATADVQLLAGTSWFFSREDVQVHTLFLDEAGQISLADALAMSTSAANVVLLGDPNQLPQVTQGAQPPEVRASVLEHLLGPEVTVPEGLGIFLEQTWRLRPEICDFISASFYEGRLQPAAISLERRTADGVGLRFVPIEHVGNRQRAPEEAEWIGREIRRLLGSDYRYAQGRSRALTAEDILVVAPYNMHVRCLRDAVPEGVAVGTVDKFQGQQAPVVFFSMASSSGAELPRGIEFLFSKNRFNVAVSRAQCLAYVVASPKLLLADARTPEQMRLINTVCRFAEAAEYVV
jgi:predicted RecB family nuclease